jgi:uncharacterized membrane protein
MEKIQTKGGISITMIVVVSMFAGVGMAHVEMSTWMRVFLDMASMLVERIFELAGGIALIASSGKMSAICAALICSFLIGVIIDKCWNKWRER